MRELLARIDARELAEWQAFYLLEPWGSDVEMLPAGIVASTVANVHRSKGQPAFKPADFVPQFGPRARQSPQEMMAAIIGMFKMREAQQRGNGRGS